ncbi:MAG: inositol monophosphatase [Magnetococcales bacterium]|nr:inositol monophosphatase [Magnetococcales bacterium]
MNFSPTLNVATRAVLKAGAMVLRHFDRRHQLQVTQKGAADFVTNADMEVEKELLFHLQRGYPEYGVLAEESGAHGEESDYYWIIDPIDGTTNFLQGVPHFAISIALARGSEIEIGVVYDPIRNELFTAERGRGAFLNDRRIRVGGRQSLSSALLATAFPFRDKDSLPPFMACFESLFMACGDIRRGGSAALDLVYTADGRLDGFWETGLAPWDLAAGGLILLEAGGFLSDFEGNKNYMVSGDVVAGNPLLHKRILAKIKESGLADTRRRKSGRR